MSDTTVVTTPAPANDAGVAFAAGAATVVAGAAAEQAQQAEQVAESARRTADRVEDGQDDLSRRISDLAGQIGTLQETVAGLVALQVVDAVADATVEDEDPNVPEVVTVVEDQAPAGAPAKVKKERKFGMDALFGNR